MSRRKCGFILINASGDEEKFLIVYSKKSRKYGFPKGGQEYGETDEETALREFQEESGYEFRQPLEFKDLQKIRKFNNIYFLFRFNIPLEQVVKDIGIVDTKEIGFRKWMTLPELKTISYEQCNLGLNFFLREWIC